MFPTAGWKPKVSKWQLSVPKPHLFFQQLAAFFLLFLIQLSICNGKKPQALERALAFTPHDPTMVCCLETPCSALTLEWKCGVEDRNIPHSSSLNSPNCPFPFIFSPSLLFLRFSVVIREIASLSPLNLRCFKGIRKPKLEESTACCYGTRVLDWGCRVHRPCVGFLAQFPVQLHVPWWKSLSEITWNSSLPSR